MASVAVRTSKRTSSSSDDTDSSSHSDDAEDSGDAFWYQITRQSACKRQRLDIVPVIDATAPPLYRISEWAAWKSARQGRQARVCWYWRPTSTAAAYKRRQQSDERAAQLELVPCCDLEAHGDMPHAHAVADAAGAQHAFVVRCDGRYAQQDYASFPSALACYDHLDFTRAEGLPTATASLHEMAHVTLTGSGEREVIDVTSSTRVRPVLDIDVPLDDWLADGSTLTDVDARRLRAQPRLVLVGIGEAMRAALQTDYALSDVRMAALEAHERDFGQRITTIAYRLVVLAARPSGSGHATPVYFRSLAHAYAFAARFAETEAAAHDRTRLGLPDALWRRCIDLRRLSSRSCAWLAPGFGTFESTHALATPQRVLMPLARVGDQRHAHTFAVAAAAADADAELSARANAFARQPFDRSQQIAHLAPLCVTGSFDVATSFPLHCTADDAGIEQWLLRQQSSRCEHALVCGTSATPSTPPSRAPSPPLPPLHRVPPAVRCVVQLVERYYHAPGVLGHCDYGWPGPARDLELAHVSPACWSDDDVAAAFGESASRADNGDDVLQRAVRVAQRRRGRARLADPVARPLFLWQGVEWPADDTLGAGRSCALRRGAVHHSNGYYLKYAWSSGAVYYGCHAQRCRGHTRRIGSCIPRWRQIDASASARSAIAAIARVTLPAPPSQALVAVHGARHTAKRLVAARVFIDLAQADAAGVHLVVPTHAAAGALVAAGVPEAHIDTWHSFAGLDAAADRASPPAASAQTARELKRAERQRAAADLHRLKRLGASSSPVARRLRACRAIVVFGAEDLCPSLLRRLDFVMRGLRCDRGTAPFGGATVVLIGDPNAPPPRSALISDQSAAVQPNALYDLPALAAFDSVATHTFCLEQSPPPVPHADRPNLRGVLHVVASLDAATQANASHFAAALALHAAHHQFTAACDGCWVPARSTPPWWTESERLRGVQRVCRRHPLLALRLKLAVGVRVVLLQSIVVGKRTIARGTCGAVAELRHTATAPHADPVVYVCFDGVGGAVRISPYTWLATVASDRSGRGEVRVRQLPLCVAHTLTAHDLRRFVVGAHTRIDVHDADRPYEATFVLPLIAQQPHSTA